ncbi:MAG: hypothetical protein B6U94_02880 [Thermofilum sp. ex4484_79]|nr:MAG: hypothetical protein B6U94_02880 [Thermofilum sp. ex4484_79]
MLNITVLQGFYSRSPVTYYIMPQGLEAPAFITALLISIILFRNIPPLALILGIALSVFFSTLPYRQAVTLATAEIGLAHLGAFKILNRGVKLSSEVLAKGVGELRKVESEKKRELKELKKE